MSHLFDERDEMPAQRVRAYRGGALVGEELCESDADVAQVVEAWSEVDGVRVEVAGLARSAEADPERPEVEPPVLLDEEDDVAAVQEQPSRFLEE